MIKPKNKFRNKFTKQVKDLFTENYKTLMEKVEDSTVCMGQRNYC